MHTCAVSAGEAFGPKSAVKVVKPNVPSCPDVALTLPDSHPLPLKDELMTFGIFGVCPFAPP